MTAEALPPSSSPRLGPRLVGVVLMVVAAAAVLAWLAVSLVHLDDRERVGHVQGAWMALARYANDGVLYPPLFDGERYGGTRWMPLGIVLHAVAARLTGSELVGGKALALLLSVLLVVLTIAVLRRLRCPWPLAAVLLAAVLASRAGLFTTTTIGGDALAVALQVGALVVYLGWEPPALGDVEPSPFARARSGLGGSTGALVAAGLLAGLGPVAKLTAGWAALAILCRLAAARHWRDAGVFLGAAAGTVAVAGGVALAVSGGRLWDSVGRLAFAGGTGPVAVVRAPSQVVFNLAEFAPGLLAVVPLAAGCVLLVRGWRELSVIDWALGWAGVALLVVFTDVGTGLNQLLDVLIVMVLAAAQLPHRLAQRLGPHGGELGARVLALAGLTALAAGVVVSLVPGVRTAVDVARNGHPRPTIPLNDLIGPGDTVLSEDPYVPVALGRRPVVLDAFMVRRLDEVDPGLVDPLIERIERGAYDYVLLLEELDGGDFWWENFHFGLRVVEALRRAYEPIGERDGYLLYRPRGSIGWMVERGRVVRTAVSRPMSARVSPITNPAATRSVGLPPMKVTAVAPAASPSSHGVTRRCSALMAMRI